MRLSAEASRLRFSTARVARLATVGADGRPHLVPVTFAVSDGAVVVAVDHKPKSTQQLRRLRNIAESPMVAFLVDDYAEDWSHLWWVRCDASAQVVDVGRAWRTAIDALVAKYDQYQQIRPNGPVIRAEVTSWSGWAATAAEAGRIR